MSTKVRLPPSPPLSSLESLPGRTGLSGLTGGAAFGMAAKKSGHNVDRNTQEKITDAGRSAYEKATG